MSKTTKKETQQSITIDDKDYDLESFTEQQKRMVNHLSDLERKIQGSIFNLEQLEFGKASFITALKESLVVLEEEEEVVTEES
jgi:hypothetical protein